MSQQIRQIADDEYFVAMFNSGMSRNDIARYYNVSRRVIDNACEFLSLRPPNKHDLAPTPEEEEASRNSLELVPMVRAITEKMWQQHLEDRKNETEAASFSRGHEWRLSQNPKTYSVYLSNGRRLA